MSMIPGFAELEAAGRLLLASLTAGVAADDVVPALQELEAFRNRLCQADHLLIQAMQSTGLPDKHCVSSVEKLVAQVLRITPGDAKRRVRAAAALGPRTSILDQLQEPTRPLLAAAQAAGEVSPVAADVVLRALDRAEVLAPGEVAAIEQALVTHAAVFDPRELGVICDRLLECLDPDGTRPRDAVQRDLRELHFGTCRDGMVKVDGRLTPAAGARVKAVLCPLAAPRPSLESAPQHGEEPGGERLVLDDRTAGQRMHDALDEACARLLRAGDAPASGGTPATVIISMSEDQLRAAVDPLGRSRTTSAAGLGTADLTAETSTGEILSIAEALRLAAEADVVPVVMTGAGQPLHLGRSRRCATPSQTLALIARDGGCSFPGCTMPPEWCERHHIVPWHLGGVTDVNNLTLLCGYHHAHFAQAGWTCRLNTDGLPEWRPPRWRDRNRRRLINTRILRRHAGRPPEPAADPANCRARAPADVPLPV